MTRRLDDIPDIGDADFFKIDVRGAELAIFEHATRTLSGALIIQPELQFLERYQGRPLFADANCAPALASCRRLRKHSRMLPAPRP